MAPNNRKRSTLDKSAKAAKELPAPIPAVPTDETALGEVDESVFLTPTATMNNSPPSNPPPGSGDTPDEVVGAGLTGLANLTRESAFGPVGVVRRRQPLGLSLTEELTRDFATINAPFQKGAGLVAQGPSNGGPSLSSLPLQGSDSRKEQAAAAAELKKRQIAEKRKAAAALRTANKESRASVALEAGAVGTVLTIAATTAPFDSAQWAALKDQLEPLLVEVCVAAGKRSAPGFDAGALAIPVVAGILSRFQAPAGPLAPITTGLDHVVQELSRMAKVLEDSPDLSTDLAMTLSAVLDRHFSSLPSRLTDLETSMQQLAAAVNILSERFTNEFGSADDGPRRAATRPPPRQEQGLFSVSLSSDRAAPARGGLGSTRQNRPSAPFGGSGQSVGKRAREPQEPFASSHLRHDKIARGPATIDPGKFGKFGVSDEDRLMCVGTINWQDVHSGRDGAA